MNQTNPEALLIVLWMDDRVGSLDGRVDSTLVAGSLVGLVDSTLVAGSLVGLVDGSLFIIMGDLSSFFPLYSHLVDFLDFFLWRPFSASLSPVSVLPWSQPGNSHMHCILTCFC